MSLSTAEAELFAQSEAVKEIKPLRLVLEELGFSQAEPTVFYGDNLPAIARTNGAGGKKSQSTSI